MASINSTSTAKYGSYQYHGKTFPIPTLTSNPHIILLADKLAEQGRMMAQAQYAELHFVFKPIPIPQKYRHIFGN